MPIFSPRRGASALFATLLVSAGVTAALAPPSVADDSTTLTVVGTSDVFDSNLVQAVLKPGFEAANPGITLNYVSKGTGAAITFAEAGTASALLVHAASLENQFVDQGYSAEQYGRAIFWGDYVLLGPASDPAGVLTGSSHDIVGAFRKIAAAGANGDANFVSRGGTPGTTVQEHAIWNLTSGVTTCAVSDANGGGTSPSTTTGDCGVSINYPSWYHATGLTQGPNIVNADACNYGTASNDCYVLTDRGTFNYLDSTGAISNVGIVVRDNAAAAPGGSSLLVNSFHAYAIDPDKFASNPNVHLNLAGATKFLNWVTSPAGQTAVGKYLDDAGDPPFIPSAAPAFNAATLPTLVTGNVPQTVTGKLQNVVPGTPNLNGQPVTLMAVPTNNPTTTPKPIATTTTSSTGAFSIPVTPRISRIYTVTSPAITKVENSALDPVFGDLLAPGSQAVGTVKVKGAVTFTSIVRTGNDVRMKGTVAPSTWSPSAKLELHRAKTGNPITLVSERVLGAGKTTFNVSFHFPKGSWDYRLNYVDSTFKLPAFSKLQKVTAP